MSKKFLVVTTLCLLGVLAFLYWFAQDSDSSRLETIVIGNEIVGKLQQYFVEHGRYPDHLDALGKIASPKWGDNWEYKCDSKGKTFSLCVGYKDYGDALYPVMVYDPNGWIYDN
jgi:hypothetical protein